MKVYLDALKNIDDALAAGTDVNTQLEQLSKNLDDQIKRGKMLKNQIPGPPVHGSSSSNFDAASSQKPPVANAKGLSKEAFQPYMDELQRRLKRAWFPPKTDEKKSAVVIFKIHANGDMSNLSLGTSSKWALYDQAALKAVENAAPFRRLPTGAEDPVDIEFTFDYLNGKPAVRQDNN